MTQSVAFGVFSGDTGVFDVRTEEGASGPITVALRGFSGIFPTDAGASEEQEARSAARASATKRGFIYGWIGLCASDDNGVRSYGVQGTMKNRYSR